MPRLSRLRPSMRPRLTAHGERQRKIHRRPHRSDRSLQRGYPRGVPSSPPPTSPPALPAWRRPRPEAVATEHRATVERCAPRRCVDVGQMEPEALPIHPGHCVSGPIQLSSRSRSICVSDGAGRLWVSRRRSRGRRSRGLGEG
jgi:hypothetical protein